MDFFQLVKTRFSTRKFSSREVEKEKIEQILETVRMAPSATNAQPWRFFVVSDTDKLAELWETYPREWFKSAPICVVACGDHAASWKRADGKDHCDIDVAIAVDHLTLAAAAEGLGSCWVCNFDKEKCVKIFNLEENLEPIALIPLGYPECETPAKKRKTLDEIVEFI